MPLTEAVVMGIEKAVLSKAKAAAEFSRMSSELGRFAHNYVTKFGHRSFDMIKEGVKNQIEQLYTDKEVKSGEISFKGNIEKEYPWGDVFTNPDSMKKLEYRIAESEAETEAIKAERNPSKMAKDVAQRLVEEQIPFMEEEWRNASVEERLEILNKAYSIIAEEACIPENIIKSGGVHVEEMSDNIQGLTTFPLEINEAGNLEFTSPIEIYFNELHLANPDYSLHSALSTLYHETIHVMQCESVSEGGRLFTYAEMQEEWKQDIMSKLSGLDAPQDQKAFTDYLSESMETYAHMQEGYFEKMLEAMEYEYIDDMIANYFDVSVPGGNGSELFAAKLTTVPDFDASSLKPVKIPT